MTQLPAIIATPVVSAALAAAAAAPDRWTYPEDGGGAVVSEGTWVPPATVSRALKADALRAVAGLEAAAAPAPKKTISAWLAMLGVLCAGNTSADDAKVKITAFATLLEHPQSCFTMATLERAGRRFKWLPSFAELTAFLDDEARPIRNLAGRAKILAGLPLDEREQSAGPMLRDLPPADVGAKFSSLRATLLEGRDRETRPGGAWRFSDAVRAVVEQERARRAAETARQADPPAESNPSPAA